MKQLVVMLVLMGVLLVTGVDAMLSKVSFTNQEIIKQESFTKTVSKKNMSTIEQPTLLDLLGDQNFESIALYRFEDGTECAMLGLANTNVLFNYQVKCDVYKQGQFCGNQDLLPECVRGFQLLNTKRVNIKELLYSTSFKRVWIRQSLQHTSITTCDVVNMLFINHALSIKEMAHYLQGAEGYDSEPAVRAEYREAFKKEITEKYQK